MRAGALMGDNPWFDRRDGAVTREPADRKGLRTAEEPETAPRFSPTAAVQRWWSTATAQASSPRA
jgi:hypothetical protein